MIGLFQYPLLAALFAAGHTVSAAVVDRRNSMPTETKMAEGAMQTEMMKEGMSAAMMADMTETMSSMMAAATSSMSSMLAEAQMSSSSMMQEASAAYSSMMGYATSAEKGSEAASAYYAATTSATYYKPSYGSGSMSGSHDLNSCLESCKAQFGGSYTATGTATATSSSETGSGSGATHTVIVAPTKGVLRYVPFSVNANVGDTIEYMWGAGPHSDAFNICNRSTGPEAFDSGLKNATSTFQYKVSSNSTTFAYCTVPNHCAKGMFTVLNPPAAPDTVSSDPTVHTSVSAVMNKWAKQNASNSAMVNAVQNMQGMTPDIWAWGEKMDTKPMEAVDPASVMMSVLYTRAMFAMNPGMINGTVSANYVSPPELATLAANATAAGISNSSSSEGSPASAISSSTASAAGASETKSSGATIATAPTATLLIFASTLLLMTM